MIKKTFAAAGAAALLAMGLAGCGATMGGAQSANRICLIQNPHIQVPQMVEAVTEGLKYAGYEVSVLPGDSAADACEHCVAYGLKPNQKGDALDAFIIQSFRNGQPEFNASGNAEKGQLTLQQIATYAAQFAVELKKRTEPVQAPAAAPAEE